MFIETQEKKKPLQIIFTLLSCRHSSVITLNVYFFLFQNKQIGE